MRVLLINGDVEVTTLEEIFLRNFSVCLQEQIDILKCLRGGRSYKGGGGASPVFLIIALID
jgi:hypothetical protein